MGNLPIEPQTIIFLVIFLISALSSLFKKIKGGDKRSYEEQDYPQAPRHEDPMQEFKRMIEEARREAEAPSSPPPAPQPSPQPAPKAVIPPKRSTTTPPPIENPTPPPVSSEPPLEYKKTAAPKAKGFLQSKKRKKATSSKPQDLSLTELLRSPNAARQAIILKEVLGKPKGLQ